MRSEEGHYGVDAVLDEDSDEEEYRALGLLRPGKGSAASAGVCKFLFVKAS